MCECALGSEQRLGSEMSLIDSKAVFPSRCAKMGLPDTVVDELVKKGWGTHSSFAFSCAVVPGSGNDDIFVKEVITPVLGNPQHELAATLRRLHFESYTLTAAEVKRQTEATENDVPRKLPPAEIAARMDLLQKKITPLIIADRLEPSHAVVNLVAQMTEGQKVRYVDWTRVTTRAQEVNSLKEVPGVKMFQPDRSGVLKTVDAPSEAKASVDTELEVFQALRRRGIAYELGGVMSFTCHEQLISALFAELQRDLPPTFNKVTLTQVAAADREIHVRLAEATRSGLSAGPAGELPLDLPLAKVLGSPSIMWLLMPKPKAAGTASTSGKGPPDPPNGESKKKKKKKTKSKAKETQKAEDSEDEDDKMSKRRRVPMPASLRGGVPATPQGKSLCFGFNLGTCKQVGKSCPRGLHACCKPNCFSPDHTFLTHPGS